MRPLLPDALAALFGARLQPSAAAGSMLPVLRLQIDSRQVLAGDLFVALPGERVDGHDFVAQAAQRGAAAALVARPLDVDIVQLIVADPLQALGRLAAALRQQRPTEVLALTGSNGKTTVKTLLHGILQTQGSSYCNPGNQNNELGMPLALIAQPEDARYAIYEMGAGQPGDIAYLAQIAQPQVALVNNIGPAHLERMGSLLGIAQTKGAIYQHLRPGGCAVVNADDPFGRWFADRLDPTQTRLIRFAIQASAEVSAQHIEIQPQGSRFELHCPAGVSTIELALPGRHNIANALAAASMALALELPLQAIEQGLAAAQGVPGRQQSHRLAAGGCLIDDSYNANPGSLAAAIATLAALPAPRWLVLGDMRELGPEAARLHAEVGAQARAAGIERLLCVGELAAHAARAFGAEGIHFASQSDLLDALRPALDSPVHLLVKGSRGSQMERIVEGLLARQEGAHAA